jgi:hypothetical protein
VAEEFFFTTDEQGSRRKEAEIRYSTQRHNLSELCLPAKLHILNFHHSTNNSTSWKTQPVSMWRHFLCEAEKG